MKLQFHNLFLFTYIALDYQQDFNSVYQETSRVVQWFSLGSFLKVTPYDLERINADYRFSHDGLVQVLSAWLISGDATWSSLVHALKKIGQSTLASKIARKKGMCAKQISVMPLAWNDDYVGDLISKKFFWMTRKLTQMDHMKW